MNFREGHPPGEKIRPSASLRPIPQSLAREVVSEELRENLLDHVRPDEIQVCHINLRNAIRSFYRPSEDNTVVDDINDNLGRLFRFMDNFVNLFPQEEGKRPYGLLVKRTRDILAYRLDATSIAISSLEARLVGDREKVGVLEVLKETLTDREYFFLSDICAGYGFLNEEKTLAIAHKLTRHVQRYFREGRDMPESGEQIGNDFLDCLLSVDIET
ncbi:hypothetical protein HYT33_01255 [Candidatus Roizmanbacteria bacterium]|nr:hypothetical protein [Candidatus Roizmanbacteria bacterium]